MILGSTERFVCARFKCPQSDSHQCHLKKLDLKIANFGGHVDHPQVDRGHLIRPTETFHTAGVPEPLRCSEVCECPKALLLYARQQFSYMKQNRRFKKKKSRSSRTLGIGWTFFQAIPCQAAKCGLMVVVRDIKSASSYMCMTATVFNNCHAGH